MWNLIKILLLFVGCIWVCGQNKLDTLHAWKVNFTKFGGTPALSPKGKWIAINKLSSNGTDTTYIAETANGKKIHKISGTANFINEHLIIGKRQDKVEIYNLNNGDKIQYADISNIYILAKSNRYALLTNNKEIAIYEAREKIGQLNNVQGFGISRENKLFIVRKNENVFEVWDLAAKNIHCIYRTANPVRKIEPSISGNQLFITELAQDHDSDQLTIVDKAENNLKVEIPKLAEISFTEIQKGKAFLINASVRSSESPSKVVDIWYGNDAFLGLDKFYFKPALRKFWFYNPDEISAKELKLPHDLNIKTLNSKRYFLCYIPRKDFNYLTSNLSPEDLNDAAIYDRITDSLITIGSFKAMSRLNRRKVYKSIYEQIVSSPDGKKFLASTDGLKWTLFDVSGKLESVIEKEGLELPVFSAKSDNIYFESSDGLWIYNVKTKHLMQTKIAQGQITRIKNNIYRNDNRILSTSVDDPFLIEGYNLQSNITTYFLSENGKLRIVVPPTGNRINHIIFDQKFKDLYTLEENFNLPPFLQHYTNGKKGETIFENNKKDKKAAKIKQEILTFDAVGQKLTGILYYPIDFNPKQKYPMVVHIYQRQRQESNEYLSPNNDFPVGFQIRTLIERGYFVFLPDILYDDSGTGLSALECVNRGLDRVLLNPNIDSEKIGLGGHSHGGYETNFIATHSNRFMAYVSGAGNSDIIRSYYSYNNNFMSPFYWQFESEQYALGKSVAEDKSLYLKNSPILNVQNVSAPILLWAGKKDENIQWDQVMEFFIGLKRYKKDVIALFYPDQSHAFFNGTPAEKDLTDRIIQWWDYHLKNEKDIGWINQMKKDAD
ncbi:alpha/beta hydrolase family protein [Sphingobacterium multivorum]|uniref:alpha/beta hydrolase family protein n=1 Tax=Sphingobacterium multivorum TaxID=28454 RepID=UPI002FD9E0DB